MEKNHKTQLLLIAITLAALAPFANKAFHIDDPLFIWMGQQVARHPLDPYGFTVNWATFPQPASEQVQNPPLCSYYIAAIGSMVGWTELALHLSFLPWAVLAILGTFAVAERMEASRPPPRDRPFVVSLLTLFTPVFLVSATSIMSDVMLLALWVWAIELWLRGLDRACWPSLLFSGVAISLAALTKYFGIALVPLLAVVTICRPRPVRRLSLLFLAIPIAAVVAFDLWTKSKYGRGLFSDAVFYARAVGAESRFPFVAQFFVGLSFLGGSLIAPLFFMSGRRRRYSWTALACALAGAIGFAMFVPMNPAWQLGRNQAWVRIEGAVFAAIGGLIVALAVLSTVRSVGFAVATIEDDRESQAQSLLPGLWFLGTFVFATFFNWSITARTFLPLAPAAMILLMPGLDANSSEPAVPRKRRLFLIGRIVAAAAVALAVTVADYGQAESARAAASSFRQRFQGEHGTVWFQSHWGFQYYMERWNATPLNARDSVITSGDVMVVPANNTAVTAIPSDRIFPPEEQAFAVVPWISTMGLGTGAAFYSSIRGPVPWALDHVSPEVYYVARFR